MTLTSVLLTVTLTAGLWDFDRTSHTLTVPSLLAEANTLRSFGDHCRSSTLLLCPVYGLLSVAHLLPSAPVVM